MPYPFNLVFNRDTLPYLIIGFVLMRLYGYYFGDKEG